MVVQKKKLPVKKQSKPSQAVKAKKAAAPKKIAKAPVGKAKAKPLAGKKPVSKASLKKTVPARTTIKIQSSIKMTKPALVVPIKAKTPLASSISIPSVLKTAAPKKKAAYNPGEFVVYPTHGVGRISEIATRKVGGQDLELVVVHFDKSRMTLRVPLNKAQDSLRKISDRNILQNALGILQQKPKIKKAMWSRRQQEYETKINSGDPKLLAEVIRDLHRRHQMADQSYTERQIYETAFDRLAHEIAAADKTDPANAGEKIKKMLSQPAF